MPTTDIQRIGHRAYCLPLRRPWVAASATLTERCGWLVEVTTLDGFTGWGDCAPLPSAGQPGQALAFAALERLATAARPDGTEPPEVRWALETALFDIDARRYGVPLARRLGAATLAVPVNAALGPLDADCAARAEQAIAQGFAIGKLKVGIAPVDQELARLRDLAARLQGRLRLRLDANRAWSDRDARRFLAGVCGVFGVSGVAELLIDGLEEPLAAPSCAALAALQDQVPFALAVDESLPLLGIDALLASAAVRRLVIKPARVGGFTATLALAEQACRAGVEVVLTSVVDTAIGVAATAHLAAAIAPNMAHGLATGAWLRRDVASAPPILRGTMHLTESPGLGIKPDVISKTQPLAARRRPRIASQTG